MNDIKEAFKRVGLGHLTERLEEEGPGDQILSGGEKQRLAFARILLHNPDIVVLDEAASALDPRSQQQLMELLVDREGMTLLSIGHRPELEPSIHARSTWRVVAAGRNWCVMWSSSNQFELRCGENCNKF